VLGFFVAKNLDNRRVIWKLMKKIRATLTILLPVNVNLVKDHLIDFFEYSGIYI